MKNDIVTFKVKEYPQMLVIVKEMKTDPPIQGLPPTHSQCIFVEPEQFDEFLKAMNDYANKR
jgi:hypothetical protein